MIFIYDSTIKITQNFTTKKREAMSRRVFQEPPKCTTSAPGLERLRSVLETGERHRREQQLRSPSTLLTLPCIVSGSTGTNYLKAAKGMVLHHTRGQDAKNNASTKRDRKRKEAAERAARRQ